MPIFSRFRNKRGTQTDFAGPRPDRTQVRAPMPEPPAEVRPAPEAAQPQTVTETERQVVDTQVETTVGRDARADHQVRPAAQRAGNTAQGSENPSGTYTVTDLSGKDSYQQFWESEIPYDLIPIQHPRVNYWTPNCISLFKSIDISHNLVNNTKFVQQQAPDYIPYAVDCYYAALVYRQILRAKRASQTLEGTEKTLLTRWEKSYPDEKLVVAKPFFPFFSTIIACELEDRKYDWNVPRVPAAMFKTGNNDSSDFDSSDGISYMLPQFPYMIGILNQFIQESSATGLTKIGEDDIYRPLNLANATQPVNVFGVDINNGTNAGASMKRIFASCGSAQPFLIPNENVAVAIKQAKRTDFFYDMKFTVSLAGGSNALETTTDISILDNFLFMSKSNNMRWFDLLLTHAVTHARFFPNAENLSSVPTVGGLETCVVGRYKRNNRTPTDMYFSTLDLQHGTRDHARSWYDPILKDVTAGFATNRAGTSRKESLQAFSFATNTSPPIKLTDQPLPVSHRIGKLYDNTEWTEEYGDRKSVV